MIRYLDTTGLIPSNFGDVARRASWSQLTNTFPDDLATCSPWDRRRRDHSGR
jgi:hypothetical protein